MKERGGGFMMGPGISRDEKRQSKKRELGGEFN